MIGDRRKGNAAGWAGKGISLTQGMKQVRSRLDQIPRGAKRQVPWHRAEADHDLTLFRRQGVQPDRSPRCVMRLQLAGRGRFAGIAARLQAVAQGRLQRLGRGTAGAQKARVAGKPEDG